MTFFFNRPQTAFEWHNQRYTKIDEFNEFISHRSQEGINISTI